MVVVGTVALLLPLFLSVVTCRGLIHWGPRLGLVDRPGGRKEHREPTPLGGGVAIYLGVAGTLAAGVACAWLVQMYPTLGSYLPDVVSRHSAGVLSQAGLLGLILSAGLVQLVVGLWDDVASLSPVIRLSIETGLVLLLTWFGIEFDFLPGWHVVTIPLTVLWIVGLTNAFNFLDNMDALSAGVAAIASIYFAVISFLVGDLFVAGCFLTLVGSLSGFLWYNRSPARIFMGDAGSNFLGFFLGVLTVIATYKTEAFDHVTLLAPLCVLAVPIYDSSIVIALRLRQGRNPMMGDRQHFSHRLVELGFRPVWAVGMIHWIAAVTGMSGLLLYFVTPAAAGLVIAQMMGMLAVLAFLELGAWRRRDGETPTDSGRGAP